MHFIIFEVGGTCEDLKVAIMLSSLYNRSVGGRPISCSYITERCG